MKNIALLITPALNNLCTYSMPTAPTPNPLAPVPNFQPSNSSIPRPFLSLPINFP